MGQIISYPSASGDERSGYLATPASGHGRPVIVIQEWWGLVDQITGVCDRFAQLGWSALAPDLYDGHKVPFDEPSDAAKHMMALQMDRAGSALEASVDALQSLTGHHSVGVVGFCMGGGLALVLGARRPDAVSAVVPCYGVHPWPEAHPDYTHMSAAVLIQCAELDQSFTPQAAHDLERTLVDLHKEVSVNIYEGCDHAFFNEQRPEVYNSEAADKLWESTVGFLDTHVPQG